MERLAGFSALVVAVIVSLLVVRTLQVTSVRVAAFFIIWLLLPYAILAIMLARDAPRPIERGNIMTTLLTVGGGLLFLFVVMRANPDPQGGIAVLFMPVYQGIAMLVLIPVTRRLLRGRPHP